MAMEEADILKTVFCTGSSGLYEFTHMPFGLTNTGASFCRLMEMYIGDQQYVTLLFYLDDICIFVETDDQMLDRIELMFSHLKEFNLKIKPKKSYFFQTSVTFLGHILSTDGQTQKRSLKLRIGLFLKHLRKFSLLLGLPTTTVDSYQISRSGLDHSMTSSFKLPLNKKSVKAR